MPCSAAQHDRAVGVPPQRKRIIDFYGAWDKACELAGCPGRIPHDLRRTAVRNLVRAGNTDQVAMQLTGTRREVFSRYNITSGHDLAPPSNGSTR
jgi:hypothetical protein